MQKQFLFLGVCMALLLAIPSCKKTDIQDKSTATTPLQNEVGVEDRAPCTGDYCNATIRPVSYSPSLSLVSYNFKINVSPCPVDPAPCTAAVYVWNSSQNTSIKFPYRNYKSRYFYLSHTYPGTVTVSIERGTHPPLLVVVPANTTVVKSILCAIDPDACVISGGGGSGG